MKSWASTKCLSNSTGTSLTSGLFSLFIGVGNINLFFHSNEVYVQPHCEHFLLHKQGKWSGEQ